MSDYWVAFYIGLFGSIHCLGMCGPLAFAVPVMNPQWYAVLADKLLYNIGRIISYSFLGLLVGFIGKQLWLYGLQQGVSIISGILILAAAFSRLFKWRLQKQLSGRVYAPVNRLLGYALRHKAGHFTVGLLNGFLPCGFVYFALVGAINMPSATASAQYMLSFGVGTLPLMLLATLSAGMVTPAVRFKINRAIPYFMLFLGVWFILRGMNLNVPYLSPGVDAVNGGVCH